MTAHLAKLDALAASLPPGAVLAHVVTDDPDGLPFHEWTKQHRVWAKIGDEPWRSVSHLRIDRDVRVGGTFDWTDMVQGTFEWCDPGFHPDHVGLLWIVTGSLVWEQDYGLRGRHEVMGVVG